MRKRGWILGLSLLGLGLGLQACGGGGGQGAPTDSGSSLRVLVTDAPFSFQQVKSATVSVQRLELHATGAAEGSFVTLADFPGGMELDLAQLQNGLVTTLFEGNPPPGEYDAVRVVVVPRQIVVDDAGVERTFAFKVPSGPQTGVKVFVAPVIRVVTSLTTDLLLDFDLGRSFVAQGNPATAAGIKGFHFKPVVRAVNQSTSGTLTFRARSDAGTPGAPADDAPLDGATWSLTDAAGAEVAAGRTGVKPGDAAVHGFAFHPGIPEGSYTLSVTADGHDPYVFASSLEIVAANLTDAGALTLTRTKGLITGTVTTRITPAGDAADVELPVEGATVEAGGVSTTTDATGFYQLTDLSTGAYTVTASKAGYETAVRSGMAMAPGGAPAPTDFTLVSQFADVTGVVTGTTGAARGGVTVRALLDFAAATVVVAETTTDATGAYRLRVPTGSFGLEASLGTATTSSTVEVVGGAAALLNLVLP